MTIRDVKTAINNVLINHGQRVFSNETEEAYDKPAFFVRIIPVNHERISPVYEELKFDVVLQYEPDIETDEELMKMADNIDNWFAEPFKVGDRTIKPPEDILHTTDDSIALYSSFTISVTRIVNENNYDDKEILMNDMNLNFTK